MEEINQYIKQYEEIFNYEVFFELNNQKISYKHIYAEFKEDIGNYCIVYAIDGLYYLGEIINNKKIVCWAKFTKLSEACDAL